MSTYLVVGAGAIGPLVARRLSSQGHEVRLASRRGTGLRTDRVAPVVLDALDSRALAEAAEGASALFNCVNPPYHRWPEDWPPLAASFLEAAASSGATLVTLGNLYPYGPVDGPLSADLPLAARYDKARVRARMWEEARRAHEAGRVRAVEVRASDFVGPGAVGAASTLALSRLLAGRSPWVLGATDQPHSWSFVEDVAATLVAVAQRADSWGRAWHVPSAPARTQQELVDDLADAAGLPRRRARVLPRAVLRAIGLFNPTVAELRHTLYQFERPFVLDDRESREVLGLAPTPWEETLRATVEGLRSAPGEDRR